MIMNSNKQVAYMGDNSSSDPEKQLQVVVGRADNDTDQQQHVVINSMIIRYKCSFCDRGFSNAQALGGHMNVHRRDRAAKFINSSSSDHTSTHHHQSQLLPWTSTNTKLDQEFQEPDDDIHAVRLVPQHHQLPLFVDTVVLPTRLISCKHGHEDDGDLKLLKEDEDDHDQVVIDTKRRQLMMHQPSTCSCGHGHDLADDDHDSKVDLELRLGPHDPDDRTGTMSTTSTTTGRTPEINFF